MAAHLVVATLGPAGTCSEAVLLANWARFGRTIVHRLFATYLLAARAVSDGDAERVLVAAAYPELNTLVFDPDLNLAIVDAFVADTPELVLACRTPFDVPRTVACVAAPSPALRAAYPTAEIVPARSNADAAAMVRAGEADAGVTTIMAAESADLMTLRSFGAYPMAWVVMARLGCG